MSFTITRWLLINIAGIAVGMLWFVITYRVDPLWRMPGVAAAWVLGLVVASCRILGELLLRADDRR